jgi:sulfur relay (sulfurtransferase) complex TusBCD TusD component (DsrE family)
MNASLLLGSIATIAALSFPVSADWTADGGPITASTGQDIVVSISKTPAYPRPNGRYKVNTENLEEVCLALTMGRMLRSSENVNVTIFVRNDGVYLVDEKILDFISERQPSGTKSPSHLRSIPPCVMPDADGMPHYFTLKDHLDAFLNGDDNNLVNCPICAGARGFIDDLGAPVSGYPYAGILPLPTSPEWDDIKSAIPSMLKGADKVIDF